MNGSKFLMKLYEKAPTRVATTLNGFMSRHGWLIAHPEMGNIGGQSSGKGTVRTATSRITLPSMQAIHVAIRVRQRANSRMAPDACPSQNLGPVNSRAQLFVSPPMPSVFQVVRQVIPQSGKFSCCLCVVARFLSSLTSLIFPVMRSHLTLQTHVTRGRSAWACIGTASGKSTSLAMYLNHKNDGITFSRWKRLPWCIFH